LRNSSTRSRLALRHLDLGARAQALGVAFAFARLDQIDVETVPAAVDQQLVGRHLAAFGVEADHPQGVEVGVGAEVDLDVVGRAVLGQHELVVEVEADLLDLVARDQGVEAHEAGLQPALGRDQPQGGLPRLDRRRGLGEELLGARVLEGGQLVELVHQRHRKRQLLAEDGLRAQVFQLEDDPVLPRPQKALEGQRDRSRRRLLGEAELVAEALE